jgi:hypothetical protein
MNNKMMNSIEDLAELDYINSCAAEHYEDLDTDEKREYMNHMLTEDILMVKFTKKNGNPRKMYCTLQDEFVPEHKKYFSESNTRKNNLEVLAVFDMEKADWRSFRMDSITAFEIVREESLDFDFEKTEQDYSDVPF